MTFDFFYFHFLRRTAIRTSHYGDAQISANPKTNMSLVAFFGHCLYTMGSCIVDHERQSTFNLFPLHTQRAERRCRACWFFLSFLSVFFTRSLFWKLDNDNISLITIIITNYHLSERLQPYPWLSSVTSLLCVGRCPAIPGATFSIDRCVPCFSSYPARALAFFLQAHWLLGTSFCSFQA